MFYRIFSGPVTTFGYMFSNIVRFKAIIFVQIIVIMATMFVLFMVFGVKSVSFGVAVSATLKTPSQAGAQPSLLITPISMLGGFFWDIELIPDFLQRISSFIPKSWGINAAVALPEVGDLADISNHIAVLLLFTAGFFITGALKMPIYQDRYMIEYTCENFGEAGAHYVWHCSGSRLEKD